MAARKKDFAITFRKLTDNDPFPWQTALYEDWFTKGQFPASCSLPTGLGKTSVVAVWLIALATGAKVPRRLVYVVNRRTVVDQTTAEVEKYRNRIDDAGIADRLRELCALPSNEDPSPLALSTLRGQFADNRAWSADPARPAVICGTVDMIGSRLLFSGYGIGFKTRPLHAGFLGQDALLVHDEAHLEPAFQRLLTAIEREQHEAERTGDLPWPKLRVMELSATSRGTTRAFGLTSADYDDKTVKQRVRAKKSIALTALDDEKRGLADKIATLALEHEDQDRAIIIFVRLVDDVGKITAKLPKDRWKQLTGTMRGLERENLLIKHPVFQRFLPESNQDKNIAPAEGTVYLVCTSAGEVGVNLSADDLVCDLSTFESMAQRFGRVNRFGLRKDTRIDIVHPTVFESDKPLDAARERTLALLRSLDGDGSPKALGDLTKRDPDAVAAAFSPPPPMLETSDILFDAWTLTSIYDALPGRPSVAPYLHGVEDDKFAETRVAWRQDVEVLTADILAQNDLTADEALELYPLKPHELLRDRSDRVFKELLAIAERNPTLSAWLVDDDGAAEIVPLTQLVDKEQKNRISNRTVLLPPSAGGLREGSLNGDEASSAHDVADEWYEDAAQTRHRRRRLSDDELGDEMRLIRTIEVAIDGADDDEEPPVWNWYERPVAADNDGSQNADRPILWKDHVEQVENYAQAIVDKSSLPDPMRNAVVLAARFHDHGKRRDLFQKILGNLDPAILLAKSGRKRRRFDQNEPYRHEFGSLTDAMNEETFKKLFAAEQDLVFHLIAVHHGRGRPHFAEEEAFDPGPDSNLVKAAALAAEVPRRFARLQRKYGRWGLAYLESLLRAADYAASARPMFSNEPAEVQG